MSATTQYLTLGLGQEVFGIEIRHVHEILDLQPIAALPHAPRFLLGMTDVRGMPYPVVDLRLKLGLPPLAATPMTRIIILNVPLNGHVVGIGFMADRVIEVTALDRDHLDAPPDVGGRWRSSYLAGIGRRAGGFVVVFDLARLMAPDAEAFGDALPQAMAA